MRRHRACQEGSWEGGGSLVGVGDSVVPCGGHDTSDDGKLHHRECNLLYFTRFGVILTGGTPRLGIPASQWHGEVLPPCHCGARIASMQYKCRAFNAKGVNFGEKLFDKIGTKLARRGEASATCRGVVSGPRAPVLGKKHVELFFVLYVARVVFYQCSP